MTRSKFFVNDFQINKNVYDQLLNRVAAEQSRIMYLHGQRVWTHCRRGHGSKLCVVIICAIILTVYLVVLLYRVNSEPKLYSNEEKDEILDEARGRISYDLQGYRWNVTGVQAMKDLVLEKGGRPHRTLLVAAWRTGSSFLGDLISSLPGNLYYYEPLRYLNTTQVKKPPLSNKALKILKSVFKCEHYDVAFNFSREKEMGYTRHFDRDAKRIWEYTGEDMKLILDPLFMETFCKVFPFQSMKVVFVRLAVLQELMEDEDLNVRLVHLVRDPRAVVQSRRHDHFCTQDPECIRPEYICADMVNDYYAAGSLLRRYPNRIRIIRFEELALNPHDVTQDLLDFLNLDMMRAAEEYLRTHTNQLDLNTNTVRKSKDVAFKWKKLLDFDQVDDIQISCRGAMELWGYLPANNASHLASTDFNPLGNYTIKQRN